MIDWKRMTEELGAELSERLDTIVDGAKEDVKKFGKDIAKNIVVAIRTGRKDLRDELMEQMVMIAEINRIRVSNEARDMLEDAMRVAIRIGKVAMAAL